MHLLWWFIYSLGLDKSEVPTLLVTPVEYIIIRIAMILSISLLIGLIIALEILVHRRR